MCVISHTKLCRFSWLSPIHCNFACIWNRLHVLLDSAVFWWLVPEVIQLGPTSFLKLQNFNFFNGWGIQFKHYLHTNTIYDVPHGKSRSQGVNFSSCYAYSYKLGLASWRERVSSSNQEIATSCEKWDLRVYFSLCNV